MKKNIVAVSLVGTAAVGAFFILSPAKTPEPKPEAATASPTVATAPVPTPSAFATAKRCDFAAGFEQSYAYSATVDAVISIEGMPEPVQNRSELSATLALEKIGKEGADTVLLGQFARPSQTFVKMHGENIARPFLVKVGSGCDIKGFARAKATSLKTAQVQQVAMHDFFIRVPATGAGEAAYENGTGLARAVFAVENGVITRRIRSYDMIWRIKGLMQVLQSNTRVTLGSGFIENFESDEGIAGGMVQSATSQVRLKREAMASAVVVPSVSRDAADYEWCNLLSGTFAVESLSGNAASLPAQEQRYVEAMKNSTLENAFDSLSRHVEEKANINDQWREMTGYLNGHPEKISEFVDGLKAHDFPEETKAVSYLALSKTVHPEAREGLQTLRNDSTLQSGDRLRASLALVTRKDVGVELAKAMKRDALVSQTGDAKADFFARNTLLHLGVLAGEHKSDAETVKVAHDAVKTQLAAAGNDTYLLSPALGAAGNLGDPSLLATVTGITRHPDWRVRELAPKALSGYAYSLVEGHWAEWLARETHPDVKAEIFDAIYHQLATAQRKPGSAIVNEAVKHLRMKPLVMARQTIINLLGPVKSEYPEAKALLMQQMADEFRSQSGLYSQIAGYLDGPEIELALSRMPEFAHQYGTGQQHQLEQKVIELEKSHQQPTIDVGSVFQ